MLLLLFPKGHKAATWPSCGAEPVGLNGWEGIVRESEARLHHRAQSFFFFTFGAVSGERTNAEAVFLRCKEKGTMSQRVGLLCLNQTASQSEVILHRNIWM